MKKYCSNCGQETYIQCACGYCIKCIQEKHGTEVGDKFKEFSEIVEDNYKKWEEKYGSCESDKSDSSE